MFDNDIKPKKRTYRILNGNKAFFLNEEGYPFDILAAIFYLLSRYEEYLPYEKDEYGRYSYRQSIAFREGFLQSPVINLWLEDFKHTLQQKFRGLYFHRKNFKFLPTYDVDIAWKYKHKGWWRNIGGCLSSAVNADWSLL